MKKIIVITVSFLVILASVTAFDSWRGGDARKRAAALRIGDTKAQVEHRLGRPIAILTPGFFTPLETWCYGSRFDWERVAGSNPIQLRLLSPAPRDVAVEFDASGRVARVKMPVE